MRGFADCASSCDPGGEMCAAVHNVDVGQNEIEAGGAEQPRHVRAGDIRDRQLQLAGDQRGEHLPPRAVGQVQQPLRLLPGAQNCGGRLGGNISHSTTASSIFHSPPPTPWKPGVWTG